MSKKILLALAFAAPTLAACTTMSTTDTSTAFGAAAGAGLGYLTADALGSNDEWKVLATLGGAAAGSMVAKNTNSATCAYSNGDGTYYTAPCP
ncbi:glycine zipper 2TM domain-containing protein [Celeribacter ethanolicus]|jgi:outer membrane lipoprotein SlyB|uniref:Glucose-6-phosphate isomerase n=1 Tax=Celeribacter ethanolicus TaxID=1758178 RepID=A0A291G9H8_9RHOB|nr:glycine zipper 2TM domain-containing protein [Celeribacter ethanolicus]ATG47203.1 glucose-6-phosphate isomerase [Celeribacter ethanolicus]TNE64947.1 MAG: glucose-6-phosphate isomerase [Paracoccaceae bacterium]